VRAVQVQFFFDPMCPWAYRTSCWIREVRRQVDLDVTWRFFSLEEANLEEGKRHPWERRWSYGWSQMRVAALLRRDGADAVDRWYAAAGAAFFHRGEATFTPDGARRVLAAIGADEGLVDAALDDPTTTDEVLADHRHVVSRYGGHGVPTLVFDDDTDDGQAFFGPVVLEPPTGAAAARLWHLVTGWREFPDLYELRRPKTDADMAAIGAAFKPYLDARAWPTVQRPAP
jgi:protein-disulfide isomerase-like protein with CxxC motif